MNTVFFYEPITPSGRSYVAFNPNIDVDIEQTLDKKIESLSVIEVNTINSELRIGLKVLDVDVDLEDMRLGKNLQRHLKFYV